MDIVVVGTQGQENGKYSMSLCDPIMERVSDRRLVVCGSKRSLHVSKYTIEEAMSTERRHPMGGFIRFRREEPAFEPCGKLLVIGLAPQRLPYLDRARPSSGPCAEFFRAAVRNANDEGPWHWVAGDNGGTIMLHVPFQGVALSQFLETHLRAALIMLREEQESDKIEEAGWWVQHCCCYASEVREKYLPVFFASMKSRDLQQRMLEAYGYRGEAALGVLDDGKRILDQIRGE